MSVRPARANARVAVSAATHATGENPMTMIARDVRSLEEAGGSVKWDT